jgi:hypothetical protein
VDQRICHSQGRFAIYLLEEFAMKSFLAFLALVVIVVLGVGYYLNWFKFSSTSSGDTLNINTQVNKNKINEDVEHAKQKIQGGAQDLKEKVKPGTEPTKEKDQQNPQDRQIPKSVP